jgi:hypothetical protein
LPISRRLGGQKKKRVLNFFIQRLKNEEVQKKKKQNQREKFNFLCKTGSFEKSNFYEFKNFIKDLK